LADQTVKIEGDSGSRERVAYDLMEYIQTYSDVRAETRQEILELYSDCHTVVRGGAVNVRTL